MDAYKAEDYVYFWNDDEENGILSNWYPCEFVIDDFCYFSVEQYMMAVKAKMFHDSVRYTKVLRAENSKECKALGRQVSPFDSAKWAEVSYEVVKTACREKFGQNPELKQFLLETGGRPMAEANPSDKIWGIGLDRKAALTMDPAKWPGENQLGKILSELREEFRK